jgi:uncharacterized membrane protein YfcA
VIELAGWLLPDGFPLWAAALLVLCAALTSLFTAAFGVGGGVMLLAIMAQLLPVAAIIPVHGLVQLGSNANRALLSLRHIHWPLILAFLPGVLLGALLAQLFLVSLPLDLLLPLIGLFVLYLCWGPPLPKQAFGRVGLLLGGTLTTFVSMFVGATGPLVAAIVRQDSRDRLQTVATFAMAMTLQHAPKALVFGAAGFVFSEWLPLIATMICSGALGTWVGLRLLQRMEEALFARVFKWLLTLLALRLLYQGLAG